MTLEEEKKWRDLCQQAICERDVSRLLSLFLEINRLEERQGRRPPQPTAPVSKMAQVG